MSPDTVVFDRYRLHEQIGAGGVGTVWRATDDVLHTTVALKRVPITGLSDDQAELTRGRALREARLAALLSGHPHVVAVYNVLVDETDIWLVMEYLPGQSLREYLRSHTRLSPTDTARIGAAVADALAAAHDRRIEHRDIKPGNILIGADGTVKLADFGISHLTGDPHLTRSGITATPAYLAPEVANHGETSPASDIFSLGSTLYTAVEGEPPFGLDDNSFRMINTVRTGIIRPPVHAGPLEPILLRLLQTLPTTRPDAATVRDLLTRVANHQDDTPAQPPKATRGWSWPGRGHRPIRRATLITAAVLLVVAVTISATFLLRTLTTPDTQATPDFSKPLSPPGDPKNAAPCPLLPDPAELSSFGPASRPPPRSPDSCRMDIMTPGDDTILMVSFDVPNPPPEDNADTTRIGPLRVVNEGRESSKPGRPTCTKIIWLGEKQPQIVITTYTDSPQPIDVCAVTEVATTAAVRALARDGGITYTPNRTAMLSYSRINACDMLDADTLQKRLPDIEPSYVEPGFADWTCGWGDTSLAKVTLSFTLEVPGFIEDKDAEKKPSVAGRRVTVSTGPGEPQRCEADVTHRRDTGGGRPTEMFRVTAFTERPDSCNIAYELATVVEDRLPDA